MRVTGIHNCRVPIVNSFYLWCLLLDCDAGLSVFRSVGMNREKESEKESKSKQRDLLCTKYAVVLADGHVLVRCKTRTGERMCTSQRAHNGCMRFGILSLMCWLYGD